MSHYTHFTTEEREKSRVMLEQGFSFRAIARKLNRSPSSVSRELRRNANKDGSYSAHAADKRYKQRRKSCGRKPMLVCDSPMKEYVVKGLEQQWSPEEISGRAKLEKQDFSVSYNTIYRAIEAGYIPKTYRKHLRLKKIKNRKRKKNDKRGNIADRVMIGDRPEYINNRSEFGHWEADTVLGKRNTGCLGTYVERKSGYLISFKIPHRRDDVFKDASINAFSNIPKCLKKSITVDNGTEFTSHKELSAKTNMDIYFCDPYSPWQRGSNENTNHLLRQYFPKGSSFLDFDDKQLAFVVNLLNNRPRKRLGFKTPNEVLSEFLSKCCT